jgi:hypothetical protein
VKCDIERAEGEILAPVRTYDIFKRHAYKPFRKLLQLRIEAAGSPRLDPYRATYDTFIITSLPTPNTSRQGKLLKGRPGTPPPDLPPLRRQRKPKNYYILITLVLMFIIVCQVSILSLLYEICS